MKSEHRSLVLRLFPGATMSVIAGAGHWVHAKKPESFQRAVTQFLEGLPERHGHAP